MDAKLVFILLICAMGLYLVVQTLRKGFAGAMFGTGIARTLGEVDGQGGLITTSIRVHLLEPKAGAAPAIGLEVTGVTMLISRQMLPVTLSKADAGRLVALLQEAIAAKSL